MGECNPLSADCVWENLDRFFLFFLCVFHLNVLKDEK